MKTLAAIGLATVALAGCGGGGNGGSSTSSSNAASTTSSSSPTLYTFSKDTTGKSNCSGACAHNWPPATSAPGLTGKVSKIKRSDGTMQVALGGHPLYRFIADKKPGDANGNGLNEFGGLWKTAGGSAPSSTSSSTRSYGY